MPEGGLLGVIDITPSNRGHDQISVTTRGIIIEIGSSL
jgi:hypothetical protein